MAAGQQELKYVIAFTTEGKPEVVEATDELREQNAAVLSNREGMDTLGKSYSNVNELTEQARAAFAKNTETVKQVTSETQRLSEAERNLEMILEQASQALQENSFHLEAAKLEYEEGSLTQDQYIARLQQLKGEVENIDAPSIKLIRRQREINRELNRMSPNMQQSTRQMGMMNSAMFTGVSALSRLNPSLGTGATTAISMARSLGSLSARTGGVSSAFSSLSRFAMSPGGIVAMLGLVAVGSAAVISNFRDQQEATMDLEEVSKNYVKQINEIVSGLQKAQGLDGPFDLQGLTESLELTEKIKSAVIDTSIETSNYENVLLGLNRRWLEVLDKVGLVQGMDEVRLSILEEHNAQQENIKGIIEEIEAIQARRTALLRLMEIPEVRAARRAQLMAELEKSKAAELSKQVEEYRKIVAEQDKIVDRDLEMAETDLDSLMGSIEEETKEMQEREKAFLAFERQINDQRINLVRQSGDEIKALHMKRDQALADLDNERHISEFQREEMRLMILEDFKNRELEIERQKEDERKQIREQASAELAEVDMMLHNSRVDNATLAADALNAINQGFFADNKALSLLIFGVEKALAISNVLLETKRRAAQATMTGFALLSNPVTAPLAGNAFAQAGAITATGTTTAALMAAMSLGQAAGMASGSGRSGGGAGGREESRNPMENFRGINADSTPGTDRNQFPKSVRLEDSGGKFLTKLQFAQDKNDEGGYLSDE